MTNLVNEESIEGLDEECFNYECELCGECRLEFQNIQSKEITGTDIYIQGEQN